MTRTIAVTGAACGIGAALAEALELADHRVIRVDVKEGDVRADLSTAEGRFRAVEQVNALCGGVLDGLVTCAGTATPSELMIRLNHFGTTEVVTGLRAALAASESPRVAVVGSVSSTQPTDPSLVEAMLSGAEEHAVTVGRAVIEAGRGAVIYPSSKSAVTQWARRTAIKPGWADAGIAVNVVAPGVVLTPMTAYLFADTALKAIMDRSVPMPLSGYAEPESIAAVLKFLVSAENTHMTGQVLFVDGGAEVSLRPADRF